MQGKRKRRGEERWHWGLISHEVCIASRLGWWRLGTRAKRRRRRRQGREEEAGRGGVETDAKGCGWMIVESGVASESGVPVSVLADHPFGGGSPIAPLGLAAEAGKHHGKFVQTRMIKSAEHMFACWKRGVSQAGDCSCPLATPSFETPDSRASIGNGQQSHSAVPASNLQPSPRSPRPPATGLDRSLPIVTSLTDASTVQRQLRLLSSPRTFMPPAAGAGVCCWYCWVAPAPLGLLRGASALPTATFLVSER
jgi:hypothetical protein